MADNPKNPWENYKTDELVSINKKLTTALQSGKLNPKQQKGVKAAIDTVNRVRMTRSANPMSAMFPSVPDRILSSDAVGTGLDVTSKVAVEPFEKMAKASGGFAKAVAHKMSGAFTKESYKYEAEHPDSSGTKALEVYRGGVSGTAEAMGSMLGDIRNWPFLMGGPAGVALRRAMAAGFSALMLKSAYDEFKAVKDDPNMSLEQKTEHITKMALNLGMSVASAKGAFESSPKTTGLGEPPKPPGVESRVETAKPTAEAKDASASTRGPSEKSPYKIKPDAEREKTPLNVNNPSGMSPSHTLELEHNGKSVGFALVRGIPEVKPKAVEMSVSEVFEDERGQHHGSELYKQTADHAKAQGADYLLSDTKRTADAERMWTSLKDKYPDKVTKVGDRWQWDLRDKAEPTKAATPPLPPKATRLNRITNFLAGITPGQKITAEAKGIIREFAARRVRDLEQAYDTLRQEEDRFEKAPDKLPPTASKIQSDLKAKGVDVDEEKAHALDFVDRLEEGKPQANPENQQAANFLRKMLDTGRDKIRNLGTGKLEQFYENYFGHLWKDPRHADEVMGGWSPGRPLTGKGSFLKQRTLPKFMDGVERGLEPVSWNPITSQLLKYAEMMRYYTGQMILKEFQDKGLLQSFPEGEKGPLSSGRPPKGWIPVNDKVARSMWGPPEAVGVLNRHLSASLKMRYPAIAKAADVIRGLNNDMNVSQVSLSSFHPFNEAFISLGTEMQRAARTAAQGRIGESAKSSGLSATVFGPIIKDVMVGRRMAKEWLQPGTQGTEFSKFVNELIRGGGRAQVDRVYFGREVGWWKDVQNSLKKGNLPGAVYKALSGVLHKTSAPIMEKMIPWAKMGAFAKLYEFELEKLGEDATPSDHRMVMGRLWDTIENYQGLMTHDNLFWDNAAKDAFFMGAHFFSWFHGTNRAAFGGLKDIVRQPLRYAKGEKVELTPNAAWLMSLPIAYMYVGGLVNYLLSKERPKEIKDYFHPRTGRKLPDGNPERLNIPSYIPTVEKMMNHPVKYVEDEYSNSLRMFLEFIHNEDNMRKQIYNPNDPVSKQAFQIGKHIVEQYTPISGSTLKQAKERGESTLPAWAEAILGFKPASTEVTREAWQNKLVSFAKTHMPIGPETPEDAEQRQEIFQLKNRVMVGDIGFDELKAKVNDHTITPRELTYILKATHQDSYLEMFKRLPYQEEQVVYDMVEDPKEKEKMRPFLQRKKGKYQREHPEVSTVRPTTTFNSPFGMPPAPPTT